MFTEMKKDYAVIYIYKRDDKLRFLCSKKKRAISGILCIEREKKVFEEKKGKRGAFRLPFIPQQVKLLRSIV